MRFPIELWTDPADAALATATAEGFAFFPIILTDRLANAVFINEAAESIFRDRAEALVNRTTLSLSGIRKGGLPPRGIDAGAAGEERPVAWSCDARRGRGSRAPLHRGLRGPSRW
jgi:hypothetical protein